MFNLDNSNWQKAGAIRVSRKKSKSKKTSPKKRSSRRSSKKSKDAYIFKKLSNKDIRLKKDGVDRPLIMDLVNYESGYDRKDIGTRLFDIITKKTKNIGAWEEGKSSINDKEELDKTMFLYGYPTVNIMELLENLSKSNNDRVGFLNETYKKYRNKKLFNKRTSNFDTSGGNIEYGDPTLAFMVGFVEVNNNTYTTISDQINKDYMKNLDLYVKLLNNANYYVTFDSEEESLLPKYVKKSFINIKKNQANYTKKIKFIFNIKNIRTEYKRHLPFKKWKQGEHPTKGGPQYKCINGSLCTESKLFSYLFSENIIKDFSEIDGGIAYWIRSGTKDRRNKNKQDHHIYNYCYSDITEDNKTQKLLLDMLHEKGSIPKYTNNDLILFDIVRGFALPCAGCQKNYYNYTNNDIYKWDYSNCEDWDGNNWTWLYDTEKK